MKLEPILPVTCVFLRFGAGGGMGTKPQLDVCNQVAGKSEGGTGRAPPAPVQVGISDSRIIFHQLSTSHSLCPSHSCRVPPLASTRAPRLRRAMPPVSEAAREGWGGCLGIVLGVQGADGLPVGLSKAPIGFLWGCPRRR